MLYRFLEWVMNVQPIWAGFIVFYTVCMAGFFIALIAASYFLYVTQGYALLAAPVFVAYAFWLAIFRQ